MGVVVLDGQEADKLTRELRTKLNYTAQLLASNVRSMTNKGKSTLIKQLRVKRIKSRDKAGISSSIEIEKSLAEDIRGNQKWINGKRELSSLSFSFPRHGVFLEKGLGRGRGKDKPKGAKDWFNATINASEDWIADTIMQHTADALVNFTNAYIR